MPREVSWAVIVLGLYAAPGLLIYSYKISFKYIWDKIVYGLLIFQLVGATIVHSYILVNRSASVLHAFPHRYWYSFIAVGYFLAMGCYILYLNKRFYQTGKKAT
jgi:hypothetical protein